MIQRKPNLNKISFVAHSVGGLVARYAIGKLYRPPKTKTAEDSSINESNEDSRRTIGGLEPMNFITVATPHLGSRGNKQVANNYSLTTVFCLPSLCIYMLFIVRFFAVVLKLFLTGTISFWCACI